MQLFEEEVAGEDWKKNHEEAMQCFAFEETLKFGISLFDSIILLDEKLRDVMLAHGTSDRTLINTPKDLLEWWLKPCRDVERALGAFESLGYSVEHAADFRKRHAEALWILAPASEALRHPKITEARDAAIDEARRTSA